MDTMTTRKNTRYRKTAMRGATGKNASTTGIRRL
jgi:hypothetical protein